MKRLSSRRPMLATLACVVTLSGFAAACGSATPKSDDVASLGTQAPSAANNDGTPNSDGTTDASTPTSIDPKDAFVAYTECMRDNGIDMPDPQLATSSAGSGSGGSTGPVVIGAPMIVGGASADGTDGAPSDGGTDAPGFDPTSADYKEASKTCQPILDDAMGDIKIDPAVMAEQRKQMLAFAKCMRDQGIDFPDPIFSGSGGGSISISVGSAEDGSSGPSPDDADFQAANKECSSTMTGGPISAAQSSSQSAQP